MKQSAKELSCPSPAPVLQGELSQLQIKFNYLSSANNSKTASINEEKKIFLQTTPKRFDAGGDIAMYAQRTFHQAALLLQNTLQEYLKSRVTVVKGVTKYSVNETDITKFKIRFATLAWLILQDECVQGKINQKDKESTWEVAQANLFSLIGLTVCLIKKESDKRTQSLTTRLTTSPGDFQKRLVDFLLISGFFFKELLIKKTDFTFSNSPTNKQKNSPTSSVAASAATETESKQTENHVANESSASNNTAASTSITEVANEVLTKTEEAQLVGYVTQEIKLPGLGQFLAKNSIFKNAKVAKSLGALKGKASIDEIFDDQESVDEGAILQAVKTQVFGIKQ